MSSDFNSYIKNGDKGDKKKTSERNKGGANGGKSGNYEREMKLLKEFASKYQGKSEEEVLREIYKMAMDGKKKGTLSNEEIDNFAAMIAPMLDEDKRKKLYKIVDKLKK